MKFSILNLLLLVTTTASIVGLYASWKTNSETVERYEKKVSDYETKIAEMQATQKLLRQELGGLTIDDPSKICAIKLRTNSNKSWSYRVHLPEGSNYFFATQINSLPLGGKLPSVANPPGTSTISALTTNSVGIGKGPGEYVVTLSVKKVDGDWRFQLDVRKSGDAGTGSSGGGVIETADGKWPNTADWIASGGVSNQAEFSLDQQCLLLDFRAMSKSVTTSVASDQGALLWVALADRPR